MTCLICRDTGIAHSAPWMGDLHTFTACTCPAGRALTEDIAARAAQQARTGEEGQK